MLSDSYQYLHITVNDVSAVAFEWCCFKQWIFSNLLQQWQDESLPHPISQYKRHYKKEHKTDFHFISNHSRLWERRKEEIEGYLKFLYYY